MDYKEYQKASYKHLLTCKSILDSISRLQPNPDAEIVKTPKIESVLHNLFYLSGYTLESIINYAIYKHFRFTSASIRDIDYSFSDKCDLSYGKLRRRNGNGNYQFVVSEHQFSRNIQVLQRVFSNSKIPLIDRAEIVDRDVIKLFRAWSVEMRYHKENQQYDGIAINLNNIKLFVETTEKVYVGLLSQVGLP